MLGRGRSFAYVAAMNVERGKFDGGQAPEDEDEFDARMEAAIEKARADPRFTRLFEEDDAASDARAEADIAAGRVVPHEEVAKWLKTWGTPEAGPPPREWFE